jgi:hypothetical protein
MDLLPVNFFIIVYSELDQAIPLEFFIGRPELGKDSLQRYVIIAMRENYNQSVPKDERVDPEAVLYIEVHQGAPKISD